MFSSIADPVLALDNARKKHENNVTPFSKNED